MKEKIGESLGSTDATQAKNSTNIIVRSASFTNCTSLKSNIFLLTSGAPDAKKIIFKQSDDFLLHIVKKLTSFRVRLLVIPNTIESLNQTELRFDYARQYSPPGLLKWVSMLLLTSRGAMQPIRKLRASEKIASDGCVYGTQAINSTAVTTEVGGRLVVAMELGEAAGEVGLLGFTIAGHTGHRLFSLGNIPEMGQIAEIGTSLNSGVHGSNGGAAQESIQSANALTAVADNKVITSFSNSEFRILPVRASSSVAAAKLRPVRIAGPGSQVGRVDQRVATASAAQDVPNAEGQTKDSSPPPTIKELIAFAVSHENSGEFVKACNILDGILAANPDEFEALYRRARIALALSDLATAKALATKALKIKRNYPKALVTLARAAEIEKQPALSLEYWSKVPASDAAFRERLLSSARLLITLERPDEALSALKEAIALKPGDADTRRTLMQLAADVGVDPSTLKLQQALEPVTTVEWMPKTVTHSSFITRRYKDALIRTNNPIVLACGSGLGELLLVCRYAMVLSAHFGTAIDLVVPEVNSIVRLFFDGNPVIRRLLRANECNLVYEVAFVLPEFNLVTPQKTPAATLRYVFSETHSLSEESITARHSAYSEWLSELTGISAWMFDCTDPYVGRAALADASSAVVLVSGGTRRIWKGYDQLAKLLQALNHKTVFFNIAAPSETSFDELVLGMSGAAVVVCDDESVAGLAYLIGPKVLFVTAATADQSLRILAPRVTTICSNPPCACKTKDETRWKVVVGACDCIDGIAAAAVLDAMRPLLPNTASERSVSAAEAGRAAAP